MKHVVLICAIALSISIANGLHADCSEYHKAIDAWHQGRIERLLRDTGYLSLAGLFELAEGDNTFGSGETNQLVFPAAAPQRAGSIVVDGESYRLTVHEGVTITSGGETVAEMALLPDVSGKVTELEMGSFLFYVIERAGKAYLRLKDRENKLLTEFAGIERFPVDESWRIEATFVPYDPPVPISVPNILGYQISAKCPGKLVFTIDGTECVLEPMSDSDGEFFIVFGDATSGVDTYGGGRFIYADARDDEGPVVIDFNKAYNPPCAFTPFATCPLPHEGNVVGARIEAGEKTWGAEKH